MDRLNNRSGNYADRLDRKWAELEWELDYSDLRSRSLEDVLQQVQRLSAMASEGQVKSVAAVAVRCTMEFADKVSECSRTIEDGEKRLAGGVSELVSQLDATRRDLRRTSEVAVEQTKALVRWTQILAFATAAYTLITGGLLLVAVLKG